MEPSSIDLGDLVLKVARDTDMKLPQDCSFEIELGRSVPSVEIDVRIVSELLSELLSRSCESLVERSDARLTIRTGYRELNLTDLSLMANGEGRKSGGYAYLEIEDNGTRFSLKAFKDALGDCNDSTLSGALRLAFEAGAAIDLASRAGERTSLRIYFSADEGSPEATASPDARKVLVVEDEIALHPMIEAVVKSLELVPDLQVDGCAAWDRLRANPDDFRLAILDVNLPGFGGDRLYELMIENCPSPLPTVFVSGDEEDAKIAGQDCGGPVRCLSKPYGMAKLKEAIVELLNPRELLEA